MPGRHLRHAIDIAHNNLRTTENTFLTVLGKTVKIKIVCTNLLTKNLEHHFSIFYNEGWINSLVCFKTCKKHAHTHIDDWTETYRTLESGRVYTKNRKM